MIKTRASNLIDIFKQSEAHHRVQVDTSIPGWTDPTILFSFANLAAHLNKTLERPHILEIGSYLGRSLFAFADNLSNGKVTAVEIPIAESLLDFSKENINHPMIVNLLGDVERWNVGQDSVTEDLQKIIKKKHMENGFANVELYLNGSSAFLTNHEDQKFDLIYIDGNHEKKQVKSDLQTAFNRLKENGLLIMDDYYNVNYPHIKDVINDYLIKYQWAANSFVSTHLRSKVIIFKKFTPEVATRLAILTREI